MPKIQTNDVETYFERSGAGPTIVFIHGAIMDHSQWGPQVDALRDDYTTVVYDIRGHGRTGGSTRGAYSIDLFVADLDALLGGLDIDRPVLCGLSLGGCIAQAYAARHPDRVAGLVLADTFTPDLSAPAERLQLTALRIAVPLVRLIGYPRVQRAPAWINERFNPGAGGDYETIEQLQAAAPTISTDEFAKVIRSLVAFTETEIDYSVISVPTVVLYGENEPSFVQRQSGLLAAAIRDARLRQVPEAGHASNLDNPSFFTAAIQDILSQAFPT